MKNDNLKEQYRINERIRVREVRLVGDNVEQGVFPTSQALKMAEDQAETIANLIEECGGKFIMRCYMHYTFLMFFL